VWKLDLSLGGHGSESLLDSYEAERLPVIKGVIRTTDTLTKVMGSPNKFIQLLRDAFIPMVSRLAPFQHAFVERLSELGIGYRGSPVVEGPGTRYFDDSLRGGSGIGRRFLLVLNSDAASSEAVKQLSDSFQSVLEIRISTRPGVALVRPDGYMAFSADHSGPTELTSVRSLLDRQVAQPERTRTAS
jgi:hypothetical protein